MISKPPRKKKHYFYIERPIDLKGFVAYWVFMVGMGRRGGTYFIISGEAPGVLRSDSNNWKAFLWQWLMDVHKQKRM